MNKRKIPPAGNRWVSPKNGRPEFSRSEHNSTPIRVNGIVVGTVQAKVFRKSVTRAKHLFREYNGYAFDGQSLKEAQQLGAVIVQIRERDTGESYTAPISHFYDFGIRFNRGHGAQICLPLEYWDCESKPNTTQLSLWG